MISERDVAGWPVYLPTDARAWLDARLAVYLQDAKVLTQAYFLQFLFEKGFRGPASWRQLTYPQQTECAEAAVLIMARRAL